MGIVFAWDDEAHSLLRIDLMGDLTATEGREAIHLLSQHLTTARHIVHLIADFSHIHYQTGCSLFALARYYDFKVTPNQGLLIVVGADVVMKSMLRIAGNLAPRAGRGMDFAETLETAHELIAQRQHLAEEWARPIVPQSDPHNESNIESSNLNA